METYKFTTRISKKGSIKIPHMPDLHDRDVDVIIVLKNSGKNNVNMGKKFIEKWAGFLGTDDSERDKYDYLSKKYK